MKIILVIILVIIATALLLISIKGDESIQSRLVKLGARIAKINAIWKKTGEALWKEIEKKQLQESFEPSKKLYEKYDIEKKEMNGHVYYVIKPMNNVGKKHILYLHGGGYALKITSLHWEFLARIIDELNCTITVPMYPLIPKYNQKDVFGMIVPIYREISMHSMEEDLIIMGDSAGGGMSLALAQFLKELGERQPGNIILISPVLDLTLTNPEIRDVERKDHIIAVPAVKEMGKIYAGDNDVENYLISPMNGRLEGLGKISAFIGTHDLLLPDVKKFKKKMDEKRIEINYFEYPKMVHIWPLFPLPESKKAFMQIINIIKGKPIYEEM